MNPQVFSYRFSLMFRLLLMFSISTLQIVVLCESDDDSSADLPPTVVIALLARNKAHTMPHFLGYLENLNYPKDRISLWIRSDHNIDDTVNVLNTWLDIHRKKYHSVDLHIDESSEYFTDGQGVFEWSPLHFSHVIKLREEALDSARKKWADYILYLDCDVFIVNNNTLNILIEQKKTIVAPLMESLGAYSNYWCGMTEQGYYKRTEDYLPILEREKVGCFDVPMVHSAVLINLRKAESRQLTFDPQKVKGYSGPKDDIIVFAYSARSSGIKMFVLNKEQFGYILAPLEKENTLYDDREQLINLKVEMMGSVFKIYYSTDDSGVKEEIKNWQDLQLTDKEKKLVEGPPMYTSRGLQHFVPKRIADTLGFDQVYLINLERRIFKRERMLRTLEEIGVKAQLINAVDGQKLNDSFIQDMGIKMLPEYADPYHKRPLTHGEIGCFLSHYAIWKDMLLNQHRTALVMEDDLRFEPYFKRKVLSLVKETQQAGLLWDLIYLGRKRLSEDAEPYVSGTSSLVHVDYSYWTLCYMITLEGAKKLVGADPLPKLVPVDEYLPIMFDRHPEVVWKGYYPKRNLRAYSAHPLLVYPTHYTGEENYISDTEDSEVVPPPVLKDEL